ncbi:MAG: glutamate racemase [Betaproteobacteria bacterium]|nr:glutamate racemase [Betaproteobacteria bacterium]
MIGIFDSGLGGLSVLAAVARVLPLADLIYIADTAHVPYGGKSESFIRERVSCIGDYLAQRGCRIVIVACNTATAAAIEALREAHPGIAVIGIEPGIKPAAQTSASGKIAVLATESTARSARLIRLIATHASETIVYIETCPDWATRIEALHLDSPEFASEIAAKIEPLLAAGVDRIVLGCTHYSFLAPRIAPLLSGRAALIDVTEPVARRALQLAKDHAALEGKGLLHLYATATPERLSAALPALGLDWLHPRLSGAGSLVEI